MNLCESQKEVKNVYHIGDIHIRKNADRHEEYRQVFKKLCEKINSDNNDAKNGLIVCTGDIFHDGMSPESIILAKDFFEMLSSITDVIIFRGNHDQTSKSNQEAIDYLASNLYKLKTKNNIYLLEKSGVYLYGKNIAFGYTDVYETQVTKIDKNNKRIKIGLWHGTMNQSKLCSGEILDGKFNCSDFDDYDYVMLGDIHKFQYLNKEKTIGYCGSLLQQDFGEDRTHGYIIWDLKKKESKHINIENDYGFSTVYVKKNEIVKQDYNFAKKTYLRIKYEDSNADKLSIIIDKILKNTEILSWKYEDETVGNMFNYDGGNRTSNIEKIDNDTVSVERLMKYINENCKLDDVKKKKIEEKVKETVKSIGYEYDTNKRDVKLKSLSFSNFNIYGEDNLIDFDRMKGIMNICGRNATGKSSLIMCICYAIWGYAEQGNIGKYDYVNTSKKSMETSITMLINGNEYKIMRNGVFKDAKKNPTHFTHNVILYKNNQDISGKTIKDVENQIIEIVGNQDEFKKLCIMDQKKNESFLDLSDVEKTKKICNLLKLDIYTIIQNIITQEDLLNNKKIKEGEKKLYVEKENLMKERGEIMKNEIDEMEKEYINMENEIKKIDEEKTCVEKERMFLEINIEELKKINYEILKKESEIKKNIEIYQKQIECIRNEIKNKQKEREILLKNKKMRKYTDIEKKNNDFNKKKENSILKIENEIKDLLKGFTALEKNIQNLDLKKLNDENEKIENNTKKLKFEKEEIEKKLKKINDDILTYEKNKKKNENEYKKYLEHTNKMNEICIAEKNILNEIDDINNDMKQLQTEFIKIKEEYEKTKDTLTKLKKEIEKYNDMEKKKKLYDDEKNKKMEILIKDRDNSLKEYENIPEQKKPEKEVNIKIMNMKKEINKNLENICVINQEIFEFDKQIVKIGRLRNFHKKCKEYITQTQNLEQITNEICDLNKKKAMCEDFIRLFDDYKYNEKCNICMSNDSTKKILKTKEEMYEIDKSLLLLSTKKITCEREIKKNEKYNKIKETMTSNHEIIFEIDMLSDNKDKLVEKNEILNERIISLEKILKDYDVYVEKINKNKKNMEKIEICEKEIEILKKSGYEDYDKYINLQQEILKVNNDMCELQKRMDNYEKLETKIENANINYKKILDEKEKINKKIKETEQYHNMFLQYNQNNAEKDKLYIIQEKNDIQQKSMILENEILTKNMEKYNYYVEIENKNKQIESSIKIKEEELKTIKLSEYDEYVEYVKICLNLDNYNDEIERKEEEIKMNEQELDKARMVENDINILKEKMKKLEIYKNNLNDTNKKLKPITIKCDEIKRRKEMLNNKIINDKIELKRMNELKSEINTMKDENSINKLIIEIIKNGFVDDFLTKKVMPLLCDNLNSILNGYVNFGLFMTYSNKKIMVYKKDKNNMLTNALKMSGYESLMANIAFRLAINNINKLFITDFFIIDEAFTFCDDDSISKMQNLFEYMRKIYKYVIIISHNEQIKSYTDTDIVVKYSGGYSKVYFSKKNQKEDETKIEKTTLQKKNTKEHKQKIKPN